MTAAPKPIRIPHDSVFAEQLQPYFKAMPTSKWWNHEFGVNIVDQVIRRFPGINRKKVEKALQENRGLNDFCQAINSID